MRKTWCRSRSSTKPFERRPPSTCRALRGMPGFAEHGVKALLQLACPRRETAVVLAGIEPPQHTQLGGHRIGDFVPRLAGRFHADLGDRCREQLLFPVKANGNAQRRAWNNRSIIDDEKLNRQLFVADRTNELDRLDRLRNAVIIEGDGTENLDQL